MSEQQQQHARADPQLQLQSQLEQQQLESDVRVLENGMMLNKMKIASRLKCSSGDDPGADSEPMSTTTSTKTTTTQQKQRQQQQQQQQQQKKKKKLQRVFFQRFFRIDMERRQLHANTKKLMKSESTCS